MATIGPEWGALADLIAPESLIKGSNTALSTKRAVLDLTASKCVGAELWLYVGRGGTTALTTGVNVIVRPVDANSKHYTSAPIFSTVSQTAAAILKQINNGAGYAAGDSALVVDGTGTPAVEDMVCIWGQTSIPGASGTACATAEWHRAAAGSANLYVLDEPLANAQADNVYISTKAEVWGPIWVPGGQRVSVTFDYSDDASGEAVCICARYRKYNDDLSS